MLEFERDGDRNFICDCCGEPIRYTMAGWEHLHGETMRHECKPKEKRHDD